jgi:molybdenum cofactor synthesis domain-containing protein
MSTAGLVVIGNEVLSGKVEEENARFLIRELRELGVAVMRVVVIRDDVDTIARDVRAMSADHDHVFTSGGVGSTHDDVTMVAIARAFDLPIEEHAGLLRLLERHYAERTNDAVRRMALLPRSAELIGVQQLRYPLVRVRNVFVFPGVPEFLRSKFAAVKDLVRTRPFALGQVFVSVGEDLIADRLTAVAAAFPDLEFGSYPRFDDADHRVKVTIESRDRDRVERGREALLAALEPSWIVRSV